MKRRSFFSHVVAVFAAPAIVPTVAKATEPVKAACGYTAINAKTLAAIVRSAPITKISQEQAWMKDAMAASRGKNPFGDALNRGDP